MVGPPEDELWLIVAPLRSLAGLSYVFGGSHLALPCLQQLDLQCDGVVIAIIVCNFGRGDLPHYQTSVMDVATYPNYTCTSSPHLGSGRA
jgi:hypothetical protein